MKPDPDRMRVRVRRRPGYMKPYFDAVLVSGDGIVCSVNLYGIDSSRQAHYWAGKIRHALRKHDASVRAAALRRGR